MPKATSMVASVFRNVYTVETLTRINNVTGNAFAISGDAPLREKYETISDEELYERAKRHLIQTRNRKALIRMRGKKC